MAERRLPSHTPLEKALAECDVFNSLGVLTHDIICDIAFDYEIEVDELVKAFNA